MLDKAIDLLVGAVTLREAGNDHAALLLRFTLASTAQTP